MADQVTISTFLELRDNMSQGLQRVADALQVLAGQAPAAQAAINRVANTAIAAEKRKADAAEREMQRIENWRRRVEINSAKQATRQHAQKLSAEQKYQDALAKAQFRDAEREIVNAERVARKAQEAKERTANYRRRLEINSAKQASVEAAKAADARLREEQKVSNYRRRLEINSAKHATNEAARVADARIREEQRVAAWRRRLELNSARLASREHERAAREAERATARQARAQKALAEQNKTSLLGMHVGANFLADAAWSAVTSIMRYTRQVLGFVYESGKELETQIAGITSTLFTQGIEPTFGKAKDKAVELIGTLRTLAAELPGEAKDYIKIFTTSLPYAMKLGMTDTMKYAKLVSKYAAFATLTPYKGVASYQLNEILQGHVRITTGMFAALSPYLKMTAREWNKMFKEHPERIPQLLESAFTRAAAAMPAMAKSAEVIEGTFKTALETLAQIKAQPFFESVLITMKILTKMISGESLGTFVGTVATAMGDLMVGAVVFFRFLFEQVSKFSDLVAYFLKSIPGADQAVSALKEVRKWVAYADPVATMLKIGAEERKKWKAAQVPDVSVKDAEGAAGSLPTAPGSRASNYYDFRNSRFDIKQEFREGFDPDRIAIAFASDLARVGEMKLQAGALGAAVGAR